MSRSIYRTIADDPFPEKMEISFGEGNERQTIVYRKVRWNVDGEEKGLRYGENPDQQASLYRPLNENLVFGDVRYVGEGDSLVSSAELLQSGKHPGKINITDADAALNILRNLTERPACVIIKHNNPCGVAYGASAPEAYLRALLADRIAAFGGAIAVNREVDRETAELITAYYAELVVAPSYTEDALTVLRTKKNIRVLRIEAMERLHRFRGTRFIDYTSLIDGGIVVQQSFVPKELTDNDLRPATTEYKGKTYTIDRRPTENEKRDMRFGWFVEAGVTSNSVLYVKDEATVAIGTGEQDRVGVARIARDKAIWKTADRLAFEETGQGIEEISDQTVRSEFEERARSINGGLTGATMISDAFFPFRDGAEVGLAEGVTAILQPGGALRDYEIIEAVNEYGATMCFTGQRSFRH
mgnify:CR=1 FL=1